MTIEVILAYAFLVNLISIVLMYTDKQRARKSQWRISERKLLLSALVGGSFGIIVGMKLFRHKTKHRTFQFGVPFILFIQIVLLGYHYLL